MCFSASVSHAGPARVPSGCAPPCRVIAAGDRTRAGAAEVAANAPRPAPAAQPAAKPAAKRAPAAKAPAKRARATAAAAEGSDDDAVRIPTSHAPRIVLVLTRDPLLVCPASSVRLSRMTPSPCTAEHASARTPNPQH